MCDSTIKKLKKVNYRPGFHNQRRQCLSKHSLNIFWLFSIYFNFDFLGLGINSPPHFAYDFSKKIFLMLYSINWPNLFAWLPLLLEILGYMYFDNKSFEINLIFQIKSFLYMTKKSRQKFKYLENVSSF